MNYSLFKLHFESAVHFGQSDSALSLYTSADHFCADTLFSALCHTALTIFGPQGVEELCEEVRRGALVLSDSMPWQGETFYLPKPMITAESRQEVPRRLQKAMKKLEWIPVDAFDDFTESLHGGTLYDAQKHSRKFGIYAEMTKASHPAGQDTRPYQVGTFWFLPDCGLYFLAGYETQTQGEKLKKLLTGLGLSGIGGKTSAGHGRFSVVEQIPLDQPRDKQTRWLCRGLQASEEQRFLLLTTSLPQKEELEGALEGASFQLVRRSGFVQSECYSSASKKKKTQYFLSAGAVLNRRFEGDLYEVGGDGAHPVYRYSHPMFLGVKL